MQNYLNLKIKIKYLYFIVLSLIAYFIFYEFYGSRSIIKSDEFININDRTSSIRSILDYSLRPLYRIFNVFWWNIFGKELESLLIGSRIIFVILTLIYSSLIWKMSKSYLLLILSVLILFISPELLRIGLGALPQIYAGFFLMMFGIFFFLKIENLNQPMYKTLIYSVISYLFAFLAVASHHTMLIAIVCIFILEIFFGTLIFYSQNFKMFFKKNFKVFIISFLFLAFLILITNYLYIHFQESLRNRNVSWFPSDWSWTYVNLWYQVLFGSKLSNETHHIRPFFFYHDYLIKNVTLFYVMWLLAIVQMFFLIFSKKSNFNNIKYFSKFIPLFISIIHLVVLSIYPRKYYYVLASFAPMASLSIVFALKEIMNKEKINFHVISILLLIIFSYQIYDLHSLLNKKAHWISDEYNYINLHRSNTYYLFETNKYNVKDERKSYKRGQKYCRWIINGNNLKINKISNDQQLIPKKGIICVRQKINKNIKVLNFIKKNDMCQIFFDGKKKPSILLFKKCN
jgi:hypothetical protein